jgi:hypothetical protein
MGRQRPWGAATSHTNGALHLLRSGDLRQEAIRVRDGISTFSGGRAPRACAPFGLIVLQVPDPIDLRGAGGRPASRVGAEEEQNANGLVSACSSSHPYRRGGSAGAAGLRGTISSRMARW